MIKKRWPPARFLAPIPIRWRSDLFSDENDQETLVASLLLNGNRNEIKFGRDPAPQTPLAASVSCPKRIEIKPKCMII